MRRRASIAIGVTLIAMLGLSACTASDTARPIPSSTPTASALVTLQEPSTDTLSSAEVDSRGFERVTDREDTFLSFASLGDVDPTAPDEGAMSFPDYANSAGAATPTAEYALNLGYWACDYVVTTPPADGKLETLIDGAYSGMLVATGFKEDSEAAQAYGDLMFRGASILCEEEFMKYVEIPEETDTP